MSEQTRCGYVAIVGRPNVGKSTLLNHILGEKISITCRKPQTTRHRVLGIKSENNVQALYIDTPGMHLKANKMMNRYMNRAAFSSLTDVDVVIFMVDGLRLTEEDKWVIEKLQTVKAPIILAVNKTDKIKQKQELLPHIEALGKMMNFDTIIPISAKNNHNLELLEQKIEQLLPEAAFMFPEDQLTDRNDRFLAAEFVREKLMRNLGEEVPYSTTVEIESYAEDEKLIDIAAVIWVESQGQKAIVIGKNGQRIKEVGIQARTQMEQLFEKQVMLRLWVKVREGWADDERALNSLGYD